MPGGKIEFGENLEEALKREFLEEVSLKVEILEPIFAFDYQNSREEIKVHTVEIVYIVALIGTGKVVLSSDHSEYRWISRDEVKLLSGAIHEAALIAFNKQEDHLPFEKKK